MRCLLNTALGVIFLVSAFSVSAIFGNGALGISMLTVLTFLGILIALAANRSN